MGEISYISEKDIRSLIESEVKANKNLGHITNSAGFCQHLIDTGNIAYQIAQNILKKHHSLQPQIEAEIIRLAGYLHDFSKIYEGNFYHEVGTAYLILQDKLGLVAGGTARERKVILKETARIIPPDALLYEELGGPDYPEGAVHDCFPAFQERVECLRRELSLTDELLTLEEFALPYTLNQQIALYADFINVNGKSISPEARIKELEEQYSNPDSPYYNPAFNKLRRLAVPRILVVSKTIEKLSS